MLKNGEGMTNLKNYDQLITREEAAEILRLKPQTLAKWAHTKRYDLKVVKVGSSVRYRSSDIENFIKNNQL